jgi:hypothetical protein
MAPIFLVGDEMSGVLNYYIFKNYSKKDNEVVDVLFPERKIIIPVKTYRPRIVLPEQFEVYKFLKKIRPYSFLHDYQLSRRAGLFYGNKPEPVSESLVKSKFDFTSIKKLDPIYLEDLERFNELSYDELITFCQVVRNYKFPTEKMMNMIKIHKGYLISLAYWGHKAEVDLTKFQLNTYNIAKYSYIFDTDARIFCRETNKFWAYLEEGASFFYAWKMGYYDQECWGSKPFPKRFLESINRYR